MLNVSPLDSVGHWRPDTRIDTPECFKVVMNFSRAFLARRPLEVWKGDWRSDVRGCGNTMTRHILKGVAKEAPGSRQAPAVLEAVARV